MKETFPQTIPCVVEISVESSERLSSFVWRLNSLTTNWLKCGVFVSFLAKGKFFIKSVKKNLRVHGECGSLCPRQALTIQCPVRLMVRTPPFHGGNRGSNPLRVAKIPVSLARLGFCILHPDDIDTVRAQWEFSQ